MVRNANGAYKMKHETKNYIGISAQCTNTNEKMTICLCLLGHSGHLDQFVGVEYCFSNGWSGSTSVGDQVGQIMFCFVSISTFDD